MATVWGFFLIWRMPPNLWCSRQLGILQVLLTYQLLLCTNICTVLCIPRWCVNELLVSLNRNYSIVNNSSSNNIWKEESWFPVQERNSIRRISVCTKCSDRNEHEIKAQQRNKPQGQAGWDAWPAGQHLHSKQHSHDLLWTHGEVTTIKYLQSRFTSLRLKRKLKDKKTKNWSFKDVF